MEKALSTRTVTIARKLAPGQTIKLANDKTVRLPSMDAVSSKQFESVPQSLLLNEFRGPARASSGAIPDWAILGSSEDYEAFERMEQGVISAESSPVYAQSGEEEKRPSTADRLVRARQDEKLQHQQYLETLPFAERLTMTKDQRIMDAWRETSRVWAHRMRKEKLKGGESLLSKSEDYRARMEANQIMDRFTPLHAKFGSMYWQMTLRGKAANFVPIGNEFSGLYCKIEESDMNTHTMVRRAEEGKYRDPDNERRGWKNEPYLAQKLKGISRRMNQPEFPYSVPALAMKESSANGAIQDLIIRGTDLFAERAGSESTESPRSDAGSRMSRPQSARDAPATPILKQRPELELREGPWVEVDMDRMLLQCVKGSETHADVGFFNKGSTVLHYEWVVENVQKVPDGSPREEPWQFFANAGGKGVLTPGSATECTFTFKPTEPGAYLQRLRLRTIPSLGSEEPSLILKGVCVFPDEHTVERESLESALEADQAAMVAQQLKQQIADAVRPEEPEDHEHRLIFCQRNEAVTLPTLEGVLATEPTAEEGAESDPMVVAGEPALVAGKIIRLHFYEETCAAMRQLAGEAINLHTRAVRAQAQWDFSAASLLTWIDTIPFRNSHHKPAMQQRWVVLVKEASVRPSPSPNHYQMMYSLLCNLANQVPRLEWKHRVDLGITKPLPHVAVAEEQELKRLEEEQKIAADSKYARQVAAEAKAKAKAKAPVLSPEEQEAKAQADEKAVQEAGDKAAQEQAMDEKRAAVELDMVEKLRGDVKGYLDAAMVSFDNMAVALDNLPALNSEEANATNAVCAVSQSQFLSKLDLVAKRERQQMFAWGNGQNAPILPEKPVTLTTKELANLKRETAKRKKEGLPEPAVRPVSVLELKPVLFGSAGPQGGAAVTADNFLYAWNTSELAGGGADKGKGGKDAKEKGKKAPPQAAKRRGSTEPEEVEEGDKGNKGPELPPTWAVSRREMQGHELASLHCGAHSTAFATEAGKAYLFKAASGTEGEESYTPAATSDIAGLEGHHIVQVCGSMDVGVDFSFALTKAGKILCWGDNTKGGILGKGDKTKSVETPEEVEADATFKQIALGNGHLLALASDGSVWSSGDGPACGDKKARPLLTVVESLLPSVLGGEAPPSSREPKGSKKGAKGDKMENSSSEEASRPVTAPSYKEKVVQVVAGGYHSMAVTNMGRLFTWGKGSELGLGFGDNKDVEAPKELTMPTAVASTAAEDAADLKTSIPPLAVSGIVVHVWHAAAGASHSLVATDQGVYVWGKGAHGVLGTGEDADATSPLLLESFKERGFVPTRVFAGGSNSMALCRKVTT